MKARGELDYRVKWEDDSNEVTEVEVSEDPTDQRFLSLVFGFAGSINFQRQFLKLGFIDITYKTNIYGFPLYHFAAITLTS